MLYKPGCSFGGFLNLLNISVLATLPRKAHEDHLGIADNWRHQVIEIMRDSTRQLADAFQFLGLEELLFKSGSFRFHSLSFD